MLVDNGKMLAAEQAIGEASANLKTVGTELITALTKTLSTFEGETKDILLGNKIGASGSQTEGTLAYFVETQIPSLITGLQQLLTANRETIRDTDKQLADAISGNGNS